MITLLKFYVTIGAAFTFAVSAFAFKPLPASLDGSMMTYDFSHVQSVSVPDSLVPLSCVYVARHGARYMSGAKKFDLLERVLRESDESGNLSRHGEDLLLMIDSIWTLSEGHWGELSSLGCYEARRLGIDMLSYFVPLERDSCAVNTLSSFVPRAMMTMYEFNHALDLSNRKLEFSTESGHSTSPLVYFFATDSVYAHYRDSGEWRSVVEKYEKQELSVAPIDRLFNSSLFLSSQEKRKLVMQLYSVLQSRRAMGLSAPTTEWMSVDEYTRCWRVSNLTHYLRNNVSALNSSCIGAVRKLVEKILDFGDYDGTFSFNGFFGHAETLLPLLSVLRIQGCYYDEKDLDNLGMHWKLQDITPLASNFLVAYYKGPSGNVYVTTRLNGRYVNPLSDYGRIVPFTALRDYWLNLVKQSSDFD